MIERGLFFACKAHQSSASPGTTNVLDAKGDLLKASRNAGARKAYNLELNETGIGHAAVG